MAGDTPPQAYVQTLMLAMICILIKLLSPIYIRRLWQMLYIDGRILLAQLISVGCEQ